MHRHPQMGERVHVRPANPAVPVPRGAGLQLLAADGQECTWDAFLQRRHEEGAVLLSDEFYQDREAARRESAAPPAEKEPA